jgi:hypothetical protein
MLREHEASHEGRTSWRKRWRVLISAIAVGVLLVATWVTWVVLARRELKSALEAARTRNLPVFLEPDPSRPEARGRESTSAAFRELLAATRVALPSSSENHPGELGPLRSEVLRVEAAAPAFDVPGSDVAKGEAVIELIERWGNVSEIGLDSPALIVSLVVSSEELATLRELSGFVLRCALSRGRASDLEGALRFLRAISRFTRSLASSSETGIQDWRIRTTSDVYRVIGEFLRERPGSPDVLRAVDPDSCAGAFESAFTGEFERLASYKTHSAHVSRLAPWLTRRFVGRELLRPWLESSRAATVRHLLRVRDLRDDGRGRREARAALANLRREVLAEDNWVVTRFVPAIADLVEAESVLASRRELIRLAADWLVARPLGTSIGSLAAARTDPGTGERYSIHERDGVVDVSSAIGQGGMPLVRWIFHGDGESGR